MIPDRMNDPATVITLMGAVEYFRTIIGGASRFFAVLAAGGSTVGWLPTRDIGPVWPWVPVSSPFAPATADRNPVAIGNVSANDGTGAASPQLNFPGRRGPTRVQTPCAAGRRPSFGMYGRAHPNVETSRTEGDGNFLSRYDSQPCISTDFPGVGPERVR